MRSFAVWYNKIDKSIKENAKADIHVNFWSQLNYESNPDLCFFDFGIKVYDLSNVDFINIYCPFELRKEDVKDLGAKISNNSLINAIFNENYAVIDGVPKHFIVRDNSITDNSEEKEQFVVYALNDQKEITLEKLNKDKIKPDNPNIHYDSWGTIIRIETKDIIKNSTGLASNIQNYYFRIRVVTNKSALNMITRKVNNVNIFKDTIETIELFDFRMNDTRSCCDEIRDSFNYGGKFWVKSIHYLVMRKVSDSVTAEGTSYNCRLLEKDVWNKYIDDLEDNFVAYHFKIKSSKCVIDNESKEESVDNMVLLLKFRYRKATKWTVLAYILVAIFISILSNYIYDLLKKIFCEGL